MLYGFDLEANAGTGQSTNNGVLIRPLKYTSHPAFASKSSTVPRGRSKKQMLEIALGLEGLVYNNYNPSPRLLSHLSGCPLNKTHQ